MKIFHALQLAALVVLLISGCSRAPQFALANVSDHLPDLAFTLTDDHRQVVHASSVHGKITLMYFGYTHCPDVCPLALAHLHAVMQQLGEAAASTRILFVSVDPARDTPEVLHTYVTAFDSHAVGLTGSEKQIEALARRYRVAFSPGAPDAAGNYEVTHSSGVYIFDRAGHARLLATASDSVEDITADVRRLLARGA